METIEIKQINETIYKEITKDGLTVYMYPSNKVNSFDLSLYTPFGGKYNKFKLENEKDFCEIPFGLAHFLEHLSFHMDGQEVNELFAPYGAYINAFTSYDCTNYVVHNSNYFKECLDTLLYYVYTPYYTDKTVENEKGIIKEEAKRSMDDPDRQFNEFSTNAFYSKSNYRHKILGTLDEIDSITAKNVNDAYKYFYHPACMTLIITGNFDVDEAIKVINKRLNKFKFDKYNKPIALFPDEPTEVNQKYAEEKFNILNDKVDINIKIPIKNIEKTSLSLYEYMMYLNLIIASSFGDTSDFYRELLDKKIVNYGCYVWAFKQGEFICVNINNQPNKGKTKEFIEVANKYIDNINIDMKVIDRKIKKNISMYITGFDNPYNINSLIMWDTLTYGKFEKDYMDIIRKFTPEIGKKIIKSIDFDNKSIVVGKPKNK